MVAVKFHSQIRYQMRSIVDSYDHISTVTMYPRYTYEHIANVTTILGKIHKPFF